MKLVRTALAVAVGTSLALAGSVSAQAPVCNLITDAAGDGSFVATPNSGPLDILSADLATSKSAITAVIRVASLKDDQFTTHGKEYKFLFTVKGTQHYLRVQSTRGLGDSYDYGDVVAGSSKSAGAADGHYDAAANTLTLTVPKSNFSDMKGAKASELIARSYVSLGALYEGADTATGTKSYQDLTPSCVKA